MAEEIGADSGCELWCPAPKIVNTAVDQVLAGSAQAGNNPERDQKELTIL